MTGPLLVDVALVGVMAGSYGLDFAVAAVRRRAASKVDSLSRSR